MSTHKQDDLKKVFFRFYSSASIVKKLPALLKGSLQQFIFLFFGQEMIWAVVPAPNFGQYLQISVPKNKSSDVKTKTCPAKELKNRYS